ncbi:enoyl-CoA hydratase/isomerase family protein [Hyphomonas johnsonii]|jgi:enoyl-CoA hydratase/carnithine racemase|uniref:Enoyl-CoA hydratase/isomerase n=1 Tax=Hyphomonas johnsonii MHS-2 TaxID=1280950 RepID=A0A059FT56_9PROT|nr:enoyl-CoA hydratase/isomerase family protein [Hyphomonas johnsonii]KCZ93854.1 enoyl-CoA hydratase/isomerase [Hyphomonas johnsonii MHS-2]
MSDLVSVTREGRIATVRFDTGNRANALSQQLMRDLTETAQGFHDCPDISAVILTGRDDQFCMGADLKDPEGTAAAKSSLSQRRVLLRRGPRMCQAWEDVDALTICAVEGWCVGGGVALATACDLRVAADNSTFYVPEVERGMNMSWGSIPRFVALVGPARTKRIAALCEKIGAGMALDWGLCDHVVPAGTAMARAREIAEAAAALPPTALKSVKQDVNVAALALARATGHRDLEAFALMQQSDDFKEGVSAFLKGRKPDFTGD